MPRWGIAAGCRSYDTTSHTFQRQKVAPVGQRVLEYTAMYRQLIEQAEKYLKSLNSGDNIAAQLTRMLADLMASGEANADAACRALKLSRRTLQRRLKAERTSFQKVLQDVRRELSVRYLSDSRLKALEVAMLLGYSNISSFTTAFKSWYDMPPAEYRQKILTSH